MKRYTALSVLTVLFVGIAVADAQEAITIKLKERGEGETGLVKKKGTTTTKVKVVDGDGNVIVDKNEVKTEIQEYKQTHLERKPGKSPTKLERVYLKAQVTQDDETTDSPLHGKTFLIEKKGKEYTFTHKNGDEVTGKALDLLTKEFDRKTGDAYELERLVLPPGAVKAGESWKIDMPKVIAELSKQGGMDVDAGKSTGKGTLVKTYKKNGRQYGDMKFKMDMPVLSVGKGAEQLKFTAGAKMALDFHLDVCIDGSEDAGVMKLKMVMAGTANVGAGATAMLEVIVDAAETQEEVATKKKK